MLGSRDIEKVVEEDLLALISSGATEGVRLEFKRGPYGNADADKKELLKDISSFANTLGGHLVIGIEEQDGSAARVSAISDRDSDGELLRMEAIIRDGVEPRIQGVRLRSVPIGGGGFALVVRVPRSWTAPHRVAFRGTNRFYARSSAGAYELGVEELRAQFNSTGSALDKAAAFRAGRLANPSYSH
jgi:predicted HTH transcriptional regulator